MAFTEGTRLRAVYLEVEGAPPLFLRWYDTVLGVDCQFADVGLPDRLVCFPTNALDSDGLIFAPEFSISTDADCTEPFVPVKCDTRFFVRAPKRGDLCATPVHLYPLWPACQVATNMTPQAAFRLGPEISLESLVSGTYRPGGGPGRIVPLTIVASDGSVQGFATTGRFQGDLGGEVYPGVLTEPVAWDTERNEMVSAYYGSMQTNRWRPLLDYGATSAFADAACSVPVALGSVCPVRATAAFRWDGESSACGKADLTSFVQLGAPGPNGATLHYQNSARDQCVPATEVSSIGIDPFRGAFPVGAPIPATAFAEVTEVRTGSKQLQVIQQGTAEGRVSLAYPWAYFDLVHGQRCGASPNLRAADGTMRCLPLSRYFDLHGAGAFADAACTVPLVMLTPQDACAPKQTWVTTFEMAPTESSLASGCGTDWIQRWHFYPIGDRYQGTVYSTDSGPCHLWESAVPPGEGPPVSFYEVGPEIPPSDFASVKLVHPRPR
jgi:hypothetical protein